IAFAFEARAPHGSWQVFVRTEETSPKLYGAVRVGSRVTVRYLPENPAVCEIASLDTEIIR
ncbi:MAG: hypothetical protein RML93_13495, partial [Anaerolineales bacterium]|nr:hypothetical protein [Anaerolineales bacterium]MDW8448288.1 hypothetical protein [Anaerolineales bacterium]